MSPFHSIPPPPVPQRLRDMLKDYPNHIQRLQEVLATLLTKKSSGVDPFERAIWALEGRLDTFHSEARKELEAAKASGDPKAIERADEKERLMSFACSSGGGMRNLSELRAYFQSHKGAFE